MAHNLTGHAEIDQQHELLDLSVGRLATFCSEVKHNPHAPCEGCDALKQKRCSNALASIANELATSLSVHAAYEEKMMALLPDTPICQEHVKAHKPAHESIAKDLKELSSHIASAPPREISHLMSRIVGDWLGNHSTLFDSLLVHLGNFDEAKVDFDGELVTMLDQYACPNRPTKLKSSIRSSLALHGNKLEVRERFESLSPAQRRVFWLVICGKTNREIGNALNVSVNTIKTHRAAIFERMDVKSALELVKKSDILR